MSPTVRLYWEDDHCWEAEAIVVGISEAAVACDRTCFYPGGGGQPADQGTITFADGLTLTVASADADSDGIIWHQVTPVAPTDRVGQTVQLRVDRERRLALARYHTVLHVLNTIALRDYGAWITGAQIGVDYSRIDFKWDGFSPAYMDELAAKVNGALDANRALRSSYVREVEFLQRTDLLRTLEATPVIDGRVRVVEIEGFDAQACGGTHVHSTSEVGRFSITRTENKGKINKRLYVKLDRPDSVAE
jgi:misacylated tRNA(Ala) deacylase